MAVGGAGASASAPPTAGVVTRPSRRALRRVGFPILAMSPFVIFTFIGLGIPVLAVIDHAFRTEKGHLTTANLRVVSHGVYRLGFENSIKLSLIESILPGILGVFLAYAILTSSHGWLRPLVTTASGVLANFGGINLTFMFIASLGSTGVLTVWLKSVHLDPWNYGFNLYTFYGVAFVYMYFQIPLMVLVITPALGALRTSWREAAQNMGASNWQYWRHVGVPVLLPSILGAMLLLFGSAFAAYATAQSLTGGIIALSPIQIGNLMNGNVLSGQVNVGYAIGLGMLVVLTVTMVLYGLVRRRASKWLQ